MHKEMIRVTPEQRKQKIYALAEADADFRALLSEYLPAKTWFEKCTAWLPRKLRNRLHTYPGIGYFLHHQMVNLVCLHMRFPEEDQL